MGMEVWMEAERCENKILCETSIKHLVERPKEKPMRDVPGYVEAFKSGDKPLVDLMAALSDKILGIQNKEEESQVKMESLKAELDRKNIQLHNKNSELEVQKDINKKLKNQKLTCMNCKRESMKMTRCGE